MKVRLYFEGVLEVEVDADPKDEEAWCEAIGRAWGDSDHDRVWQNADLTGHSIVSAGGEMTHHEYLVRHDKEAQA